jgi:hypothetical protein
MALVGWAGRAIGLDVHRDSCVVAICDDGHVRSGARVPSTPDGLRTLAKSRFDGGLEASGGVVAGNVRLWCAASGAHARMLPGPPDVAVAGNGLFPPRPRGYRRTDPQQSCAAASMS